MSESFEVRVGSATPQAFSMAFYEIGVHALGMQTTTLLCGALFFDLDVG